MTTSASWQASTIAPAAAARVLVVDDTPQNVKLLADLLGAKGFVAITAASGSSSRGARTRRKPMARIAASKFASVGMHPERHEPGAVLAMPAFRHSWLSLIRRARCTASKACTRA